MTYVYLALAIVTEVIGTSLLKSTEEFTKTVPSVIVIVCYLLSFWLLTLTLREMARRDVRYLVRPWYCFGGCCGGYLLQTSP